MKKPRLIIKEKLICVDNFIDSELDIVISNLQSLKDEYKDKFTKLSIVYTVAFDEYYNEYFLIGTREETDEEYKNRMKKLREEEERLNKRRKKNIITEKEKRRKLWLKLKAEFEAEGDDLNAV